MTTRSFEVKAFVNRRWQHVESVTVADHTCEEDAWRVAKQIEKQVYQQPTVQATKVERR